MAKGRITEGNSERIRVWTPWGPENERRRSPSPRRREAMARLERLKERRRQARTREPARGTEPRED